jgi:uncharacterized protein
MGPGTHRVVSARVGESYFSKKHPGVYVEREFGLPRGVDFWTGVPAFLGIRPEVGPTKSKPKPNVPIMLSLWSHFQSYIGTPEPNGYLGYAVRGFFANGGQRCYVVPLADKSATSLNQALEAIEPLKTLDLVCAPDLVKEGNEDAFELQQLIVDHCEMMGDRFAILDSRKGDSKEGVAKQWSAIDGKNGAIYYPWVTVEGFKAGTETVPPSGHIAGIYARTDMERGVHKAPANEVLEGILDLEQPITNAEQDELNFRHVNCLRAFPGRGMRVWGARTLSGEPAWAYVNVRRIFLTAARWMEWNMCDVAFEPHNPRLWARIERELTTYFNDQFLAGALRGRTPQEAFYVKCNAETNPPDVREAGQVITEIGLAPTIPYEFVIVRLIHGTRGVSMTGPTSPE